MQYVSDIDNQPLADQVNQVNNWNRLLGLTPLFGNIQYLTTLSLGIMVICDLGASIHTPKHCLIPIIAHPSSSGLLQHNIRTVFHQDESQSCSSW